MFWEGPPSEATAWRNSLAHGSTGITTESIYPCGSGTPLQKFAHRMCARYPCFFPISSTRKIPRRPRSTPNQWLFLDTETTGLAGGTGTYAFMVGIAWWDAGGLQVEQFFLRDLDEEHTLLLELSERMKQRPVLVTFNGKSFDWPLLETRYRMTRAVPAFSPKLHLDLLHPARQLWQLRLGSVRLKDLERHVLGAEGRSLDWSRHDDIDSSLIPQMYFDYFARWACRTSRRNFPPQPDGSARLAALAGKIPRAARQRTWNRKRCAR